MSLRFIYFFGIALSILQRIIERLRHYFATYKMKPGEPSALVVERAYGRAHAHNVVEAAMRDYQEEYGAQAD